MVTIQFHLKLLLPNKSYPLLNKSNIWKTYYLYDRPLLTSTTTIRNASSENFQTKSLKTETTI